jgi:hypothetical protein
MAIKPAGRGFRWAKGLTATVPLRSAGKASAFLQYWRAREDEGGESARRERTRKNLDLGYGRSLHHSGHRTLLGVRVAFTIVR